MLEFSRALQRPPGQSGSSLLRVTNEAALKTKLWAGTSSSDPSHLGLNYRASSKAHFPNPAYLYPAPTLASAILRCQWLRLKPRRATSTLGLPTLAEGTSPRFGEGHFGFKLASGFQVTGWVASKDGDLAYVELPL